MSAHFYEKHCCKIFVILNILPLNHLVVHLEIEMIILLWILPFVIYFRCTCHRALKVSCRKFCLVTARIFSAKNNNNKPKSENNFILHGV